MWTSSVIQPAAASLEEAARARLAVSANRTRSTLGSSLRPVSCPRITASRPRLTPDPVQHVGAAERPGAAEGQLAGRGGGDRAGRVQQPGQRGDQPLDRVLVQLVLAAEGVQDLGPGDPGGGVPLVVGQLQVPDDLAVFGLARGRLHVHRHGRYQGAD